MKLSGIALVICAAAAAQSQTSPAKDSDALQSLLAEVHLLRQDIESMAIATQRVQIALYRLQAQTAATSASEQKLDAARLRCAQMENQKRNIESMIQHLEVTLAAGALERGQTKELQANQLQETKHGLDAVTSELQSCRVAEVEAVTRLRNTRRSSPTSRTESIT